MSTIFGIGSSGLVMVLLLGGGGFGLPVGIPPLPEDAALVRVAPEECLWYLSWYGTAEADPQSPNQTEQLLAEEEVRQFAERLESGLTSALGRGAAGDDAGELAAAEVPGLLKTLLTRPTAIFVSQLAIQPGGADVRGGLVVNTGDRADQVRASLLKLEALLLARGLGGARVEETSVAGAKFRRIPTPPPAPPVLWGFKGEYLIVAVGKNSANEILARLDAAGEVAPWLANLHHELPIERPGVVSYLNIAGGLERAAPFLGSPQARAAITALGLDNVKSVGSVAGLGESGCVAKTLVAIDGEAEGLFACLSDRPLAPDDLQPIPRDANMAAAARFDLADIYGRIIDGIGQVDPAARAGALQEIARLEESLGFRLSEDLLEALGDVWCFYNSPSEGGVLFTGMAAAVQVRDRDRLASTHDKIVEALRNEWESIAAIKEFTFREHQVYYLQSTSQPLPVAPAWCLTDDALVVALYPQTIKAYLARGREAGSLADLELITQLLEGDQAPAMLSYEDTASLLPLFYPVLQVLAPVAATELEKQGIHIDLAALPSLAVIGRHVSASFSTARRTEAGLVFERHQSLPGGGAELTAAGPVAIALLLPAVSSAREAARRAQSMNNLKQIALAMHNYHDVYKSFPAAASYDKQGKPLLSWRVHILPFVEEVALYKQFHLDEPWDSQHNRELIKRMPDVYHNPNSPEPLEAGKTNYLLPVGEKSLFGGKKGPRFAEITDGFSFTIMTVEAGWDRAVIWTKPDDLKLDPKKPLAGLTGMRPGGFLAGLADGSVRVIDQNINQETLRLLFDPRDGQLIPDF